MKLASLAIVCLAVLVTPSLAQTPVPANVDFKAVAEMPTLRDASKFDSFAVEIKDVQIDTTLVLSCSAGRSAFLGLAHSNKVCAFDKGSNGQVFNPKKSTWQPRTQYLGQYTVTGDGTTDAKTMSINYLPQGNQAQFGGSLNLKPELTSSGAAGLKDLVMKKLQGDASTPINAAVDTIDFNNFFVPSAGLPSDKGCTWAGNSVFPYQNYSWYMKLTATCDGQTYELSGNMPFNGDSSVEGNTTYDLVLTLGGGAVQTDDALFADATDDSLFADVPGITGKITMKNTNIVKVTVDGEDILTPQHVEASGTLSGTQVPITLVRSFATLIGLLPSTFFGA